MQNDELLPVTQALKGCPFCGQAPTIEPWHGGAPTKVMIGCPGLHPDDDIAPCEVAPQVTGETPAEAIGAWNTRTALSGDDKHPEIGPGLPPLSSGEGREDVDYWNEIAQQLGHESVCEALEKLAELQDAAEGRSNGAGEDDLRLARGTVEAYLVERLRGEGYGPARRIIDARKCDPTSDDYWVNAEAKNNHRVTPLAALSAPQGEVERGSAIDDIAAERRRQIEAEGWTPEHDDEHSEGDLSRAAACYAAHASAYQRVTVPLSAYQSAETVRNEYGWPWAKAWWKPSTPRRDLVKAGALIVAEIERIDRAALAHKDVNANIGGTDA